MFNKLPIFDEKQTYKKLYILASIERTIGNPNVLFWLSSISEPCKMCEL
jgi:hypothetical protein